MMTRARGKAIAFWTTQSVLIDDPPVNSPAAMVLLFKNYFSQDKDIYSETRMKHLRDKWMRMKMKTPDELGGLTCACCGRKGLHPHPINNNDIEYATLDHIVDISDGGSWRDPSNFQVLCYPCNQAKSNK